MSSFVCSMPKKIEPFLFLNNCELDYLNSEKNLTKKLYKMADMLSLTRDEHHERECIVNEILGFLKPYYPECDIVVFGSSSNGFGFTGCDLDLLFLPFPEYCNLDFQDKSGPVPTLYYALRDPKTRSKLYEMSDEMHLTLVQRIMFSVKRYFKKVQYIPAKCPILNLEFHFSDVHCDFSASNRLVVYNTQLMWVFGKLDYRVKPLVMFLRFWAKSLGFISKSLLSSYCLTLLVIYYLQNTHPAVLPSVKYLHELSGFSRIIDGWETAICSNVDFIHKTKSTENSLCVGDLLKGFFDFYWNFPFVSHIVSVYHGAPLHVQQIKESRNERMKDFQVKPFSVQDPFILSRNVSRNSTMKTAFKLSLMIAKDLICRKDLNLKQLFDSAYYENEMNLVFGPFKRNLHHLSKFFSLQLTYELHSKLGITSNLKPWYDKVCQGVLDILQYGLLFDCEVIDKDITEPPTKKRKKAEFYNIGDLKCVVSIQCVVNVITFCHRNRVEVLKHLKETNVNFEAEDCEPEIPACLKTEHKISKALSKEDIKNVPKLPEMDLSPPYFSFFCECYRYPESQISDILISFSPQSNPKSFNRNKDFVKTFIQKNINSVLL